VESLRQSSHEALTVGDEADVGAVRRAAMRHGRRLGADDLGQGRVALVATELATNLLRHARPGGSVLIRTIPPSGVELIAVDQGPGIADLARALDGRGDSPGGLGCGLAAVRRASSRFDVHTRDGRGTTVLAVVDIAAATPAPGPAAARTWAGVSTAVDGDCGDGWAGFEMDDEIALAVVDGLGHGPRASAAADAALDAFAADPGGLDRYLARANAATRDTRGAAVAVCRLRRKAGELDYVAVGNISARLCHAGQGRGLVTVGGTVGTQLMPPAASVTTYPWPRGARLVLWTDGLTSQLDLQTDPDLLAHDPAVAAAVLHRDHSRHRDDATVVVLADPDVP
jgi:anti-sigma regulatory factor (Ser/Thr protein kinase)